MTERKRTKAIQQPMAMSNLSALALAFALALVRASGSGHKEQERDKQARYSEKSEYGQVILVTEEHEVVDVETQEVACIEEQAYG
jgi:hypothetical protein